MTDIGVWMIWNGSLGILDLVRMGPVEGGAGGRTAWLAPPYDMVGPFSFDDLETHGRIAFGACLVMSRQRWQADQVDLRREGLKLRQALLRQMAPDRHAGFRDILDLPTRGPLQPSDITAAFRRQAKTAHPDAGGSAADYRRIAEARDALLAQCDRAS